MAKKLRTQYPSFFQVMNYSNFQSLRVPIAFRQKHKEVLSTGKAYKLRICSGETWDVKVEKMEDGYYHFSQGWEKFVRDFKLEEFDILEFSFSGQSTFEVSAYGSDACGKDSFDRSYLLIEDSSDDDGEGAQDDAAENSNAKFKILLGKQQVSRVDLRKRFAEAARLFGRKKVVLEYRPNGFRSEVALDFRSPNMRLKLHGFRLDLANGWRSFREANGLRYGKTYLFEFVASKDVIEVKEVKMKKNSHSNNPIFCFN